MKEKIKQYWWVIVIILIIGGIFYWFQWKPSQIRKECSKELKVSGRNLEARELFYKACLRENGLEK